MGYDSFPENIVWETKKQILDTLVATVAGSLCVPFGHIRARATDEMAANKFKR